MTGMTLNRNHWFESFLFWSPFLTCWWPRRVLCRSRWCSRDECPRRFRQGRRGRGLRWWRGWQDSPAGPSCPPACSPRSVINCQARVQVTKSKVLNQGLYCIINTPPPTTNFPNSSRVPRRLQKSFHHPQHKYEIRERKKERKKERKERLNWKKIPFSFGLCRHQSSLIYEVS